MKSRKNRKKSRIASKNSKKMPLFVKIAVVWVAGYLLFSIGSQQVQLFSLEKELSFVQARISEEENRAEELEDTKQKVNTPEYKERMAREKLGLLRPDEKIFIDATVK